MDLERTQSDPISKCPPWDILLLHATGPEILPQQTREQLLEHLCTCSHCADIYDVICEGVDEAAEGKADIEDDASLHAAGFMTMEQSRRDIWRRVEAAEAQAKCERHRRRVLRIGKAAALAACLLLAVGIFWQIFIPTPPAKPAAAVSPPQPSSDAHLVLSGENPLGDAPSLIIPEPPPIDPAKADYAKWLGEHKESCTAGRPWIAQVCNALQAHGHQVDYLDVLMVSGDIWQFHFDSKQPFGQPLAVHGPTGLSRLAEYYRVPVESLRLNTDSTILASAAPVTATQALGRWQSAMIAENGSQMDLYLYTVQAGPYLAQTRAAAALWVYRHPQAAQKLLASSGYRSACQIPSHIHDAQAWGRMLMDQATAATRCVQAVNELLRMPNWDPCAVEAIAPWQRLKQSVDELVPAGAEEGGK